MLGFLDYQAKKFGPYPEGAGESQMVLGQKINLMHIVKYKDKTNPLHEEIICSWESRGKEASLASMALTQHELMGPGWGELINLRNIGWKNPQKFFWVLDLLWRHYFLVFGINDTDLAISHLWVFSWKNLELSPRKWLSGHMQIWGDKPCQERCSQSWLWGRRRLSARQAQPCFCGSECQAWVEHEAPRNLGWSCSLQDGSQKDHQSPRGSPRALSGKENGQLLISRLLPAHGPRRCSALSVSQNNYCYRPGAYRVSNHSMLRYVRVQIPSRDLHIENYKTWLTAIKDPNKWRDVLCS